MSGSYWADTLNRQISRRRALATAGSGSVAATLLAACGGGDSGGGDANPASSLIFKPTDTSAQAKTGGTFTRTFSPDPPSVDPIGSGYNPGIEMTASYAYPRLLKFAVSKYPEDYKAGAFEGDLAESYELSPDKLRLTLKLRQGLKWDLPSGRTIDAEDVLFSWKRTTTLSRHRVLTDANSAPDAPIESITAPDSKSILIKLVRPDPAIFNLLAHYNLVLTMPREAESGFDPRNEIRGYGPWKFVHWKPSEGISYKRNPDYYVKGKPYFDGVELINMPEYATRLAQFRAGNVMQTPIRAEDILPTKRDMPQLLLMQADQYPIHTGNWVAFGYEGNSQFKDQRVRQAFSMMIDREAISSVVHNADKFSAEGLDVQLKLKNATGPSQGDYWINPDDKAFGPNARFNKPDMVEAKKLMAAAGFASGFDTSFVIGTTNLASDITVEQLREGGIRSKYDIPPNSAETNRRLTRAYALFENNGSNGFYSKGLAEYADFGVYVANGFLSGGGSFIGMTTTGRDAEKGDPQIDEMVRKIRAEFDVKKAKELAHEWQRVMAEKAYIVGQDHGALPFSLYWPAYQNIGLYRTSNAGGVPPSETLIHSWMDTTKAPFGRS